MSKFLVLAALLFTFFVAAPVVASAAPQLIFNAKVFDLDSHKTKQLFSYKNEAETAADGTRTETNTFTSPDGSQVAVIETTVLDKDGKLMSYKIDQKQISTVGLIEVQGDKLKFTYTKDGKTKTSEEKPDGPVLVGPTILPYLQANWKKIIDGESLKVRFAVADRLETVGFEYFKEKGDAIDGRPAVVVKMKPSSFVIAALVDPLHFYIEPDGKKLIEVQGRTQAKRSVDGKFKDLDAETTFDYVATEAPAGGNSK